VHRLALPAGFLLAVVLAAPAAAGGDHTVSFTETFHGTSTSTDTNPCASNDTVDITQTGNGVQHVTYFPAGDELWATFTQEGAFSGVDEITGVVYTGRSTVWGNYNVNEQNSNSTFTFSIRATGSDGSTMTGHETTHFTMIPGGSVVVSFDKIHLTCGG